MGLFGKKKQEKPKPAARQPVAPPRAKPSSGPTAEEKAEVLRKLLQSGEQVDLREHPKK